MTGDYVAWKFWFDVVQAAGTVAVAIYVWWDRRKKDTEKRFKALEKAQAILQADVNLLPDRQELSDLSKQIGSLTEKLATLDGRLGGINRAVDLLNQHHLGVKG